MRTIDSLGGGISGSSAPRRQGGGLGYMGTLPKRVGSKNKRLPLIILKSQISQVKEISAFLCVG